MPCPHRTVHAASDCWHKTRVPLVEWSEFKDEQHVRLNPELKITDGEKNAFGLLPSRAPILFEARRERLFLLAGLELCQQQRMADADLLAVKGIDHHWCKLGQLQTSRDISRILPRTCGDLFDGVFWLVQIQESTEAAGFFQRVNVTPHQIFD